MTACLSQSDAELCSIPSKNTPKNGEHSILPLSAVVTVEVAEEVTDDEPVDVCEDVAVEDTDVVAVDECVEVAVEVTVVDPVFDAVLDPVDD